MNFFSLGFDPQSLQEITRLQGIAGLLNPEITAALAESGKMLVGAAQAKTWEVFANPTGQLADSITFYVASPTEVDLVVGVPYGQRRERGFSGMTDALGRYYPYDPAKPYLEPTIAEHEQDVLALLAIAVDHALGRVAVA